MKKKKVYNKAYDMVCAACGARADGNYSTHRDGHGIGPQVMLCDGCGSGNKPTWGDMWKQIRYRHMEGFEMTYVK